MKRSQIAFLILFFTSATLFAASRSTPMIPKWLAKATVPTSRQSVMPRMMAPITPPSGCTGGCCDADNEGSGSSGKVAGTTYWKTTKANSAASEIGASIQDKEEWHSGVDACKWENGPYLVEYSCENYDPAKAKVQTGGGMKPMWNAVECPTGQVCSGGTCVKKVECKDADGGVAYFNGSYVQEKKGDAWEFGPKILDTCVDDKILEEQICVQTPGGSQWESQYVDCAKKGLICNVDKHACDMPGDGCQIYDGKNPTDDSDDDGVPDIVDFAPEDPKIQYSPYPLATATVGKLATKCAVGSTVIQIDGKFVETTNCPEDMRIEWDDLMVVGSAVTGMVLCEDNLDTDKDGLSDCEELVIGANPNIIDTDSDGITDFDESDGVYFSGGVYFYGKENQNAFYRVTCNAPTTFITTKSGESMCQYVNKVPDPLKITKVVTSLTTDPLNPDTDGDGVTDGTELLEWKGDPLKWDTDCDGIADGLEDNNHDGVVTFSETATNNPDTDSDGLLDGGGRDCDGMSSCCMQAEMLSSQGEEDANNNGIKEPWETDPKKVDTDGDGIQDPYDSCPTNPSSTCCPLYEWPPWKQ